MSFYSNIKLKAVEKAPEATLVLGIGFGIAALVSMIRKAGKGQEVLEEHKRLAKEIDDQFGTDTLTKEEKRERAGYQMKNYKTTAVELFKVYGPTVGFELLSIILLLYSHGIVRGREASAIAAYTAVDGAYKQYRQNVIADQGEEKDQEYGANSYLVNESKLTVNETTGEEVMEEVSHAEPKGFAYVFGPGNMNWSYSGTGSALDENISFLSQVFNYEDQCLIASGYQFVNDVLPRLDLPKVKEGQLSGWVYDPEDPNRANKVNHKFTPIGKNGRDGILIELFPDGIILDSFEKARA